MFQLQREIKVSHVCLDHQGHSRKARKWENAYGQLQPLIDAKSQLQDEPSHFNTGPDLVIQLYFPRNFRLN